MQGRGRGSYLGILLDSQSTMVGRTNVTNLNEVSDEIPKCGDYGGNVLISDEVENICQSESQTCSIEKVAVTTKSQDQPRWTSLDLLGNKTRRARISKSSSMINDDQNNLSTQQLQQAPINREMKEDLEKVDAAVVITSQTLSPINGNIIASGLQNSLKLKNKQVIEDHSTQTSDCDNNNSDISSETSSTSTGSASNQLYIPPHKRLSSKNQTTEISNEEYRTGNWWTKKMNEVSTISKTGESELNWQKWKLQRSFKNLLQHINMNNVTELAVNIESIVNDSKLSHNFPGVSKVTLIVENLVQNICDKKLDMDIAVFVCQLLNAIYPEEFPSSLRVVIKDFRQELFAGIYNKNIRCDNFCAFLGKLCDIGRMETKSYQECLKQSVFGCLCEWISMFQNVEEDSREAIVKIKYLCHLLDLTKNVMSFAKRSWIKLNIEKIKNCVLNQKLPRDIKEKLLDTILNQLLSTNQQVIQKTLDNKRIVETNKNSFEKPQEGPNLYNNVEKMLSELGLEHLLEKFKDNLIRDSLLHVDKDDLKYTLQEAGFASGAVLEILLYLEKNDVNCFSKDVESHTAISPTTRIRNVECGLVDFLKKQAREEKTFKSKEQVELLDSNDEKPKVLETPPGFSNYQKNDIINIVEKEQVTSNKGKQTREVSLITSGQSGEVNEKGGNHKVMTNTPNIPKGKGRGRGRGSSFGKAPLPKITTEKLRDAGPFATAGTYNEGSSDTIAPGVRTTTTFIPRFQHKCLICGSDDHRSGSCKNYEAMFD